MPQVIKAKLALLLFLAVTLITLVGQNRTNLSLEEMDRGRIEFLGRLNRLGIFRRDGTDRQGQYDQN